VAQLIITAEEAALHRLVGTETFLRGRRYVHRGDVLDVQWHPQSRRAFGQVGGDGQSHSAIATLAAAPDGAATSLWSTCTCSSGSGCSHAVALLLAAMPKTVKQSDPVGPPAPWESCLAPLVGGGSPEQASEPAEVGLQFELLTDPPPSKPTTARAGVRSPFRIGLRPVLPGRSGGWVRTGISWSNLGYARYSRSHTHALHTRLLGEILRLASDASSGYYGYHHQHTLFLESIPSRRIWDLLAEARELGLPLVQAGNRAIPVTLQAGPARLSLAVGKAASGLDLQPRISVDGSQVVLAASLLLGEPAHGIAWWQAPDEPEPHAKHRVLRLAPLASVIDSDLKDLLVRGTIHIPERDEDRFLTDYYPTLRQRVSVVPADDTVDLPQARPPVLALAVDHLAGHRVALAWEWAYPVGEVRHREPLWPESGTRADRDGAAEADILRRVTAAVGGLPELLEDSPDGPRLAPVITLGGIAMIRLLNEVLPALEEMPDVEVTVARNGPDGIVADYREADAAPVVSISGAEVDGERDWFDLAVSVSVDGEEVPFHQLFVALTQEQEYLILPSGTYFSLDREEFRQLAALIAEARALQDTPGDTVRLSRFQAGMWAELERIGVVSGQAAAWQESVRSLSRATELVEHPAPEGLHATVRPYQLAGFNWLAALYTYRLGGVLADDMGLGKTLQALALISHVRERGLAQAPFLVVAPTSVVFNWAAEAARFTPGLKVATVTETQARRGAALADLIEGAHVVVTSYTLFRLEYGDYEAVEWAGLLLDEAQFVKNHQSQSYQCVKKLPTPFKLAITGTPMENNLMELWSLLSITAPGLFANPTRFTEYYRKPIEKGKDGELLAQLRRRIRPLMLRRTKEQVVSDLPDKQEQVLELELNPKHKKIYQTHLQRERQKVLGLLGDLAKNRFEIFRSLTLLRQASLDVALIDPKYGKIPSTKLDAMTAQVADIVSEGHRTLIFSQFTRFLDSARRRLDAAGIDYCYLDGSTRNRTAVLESFKTGSAPVFLISLKAGGFGLNLTEADYCILLDPWWNPATEAQAVDRVHRIGQTKKVMVYRLVAKDTIEEKVMALKATKAALFSSVMDDGAFESAALSASDIRGLLD